jgi:hypothetical protein
MAIKTLRVFAEFTSTGFVPMPTAGNIDYGYTLASTFPSATPSSFQTDNPDLVVTVTAQTDFYVWIRLSGTAWNPSYTRNVRVYPDSPDINNVVMNMIIATGPAGTSAYSQIVQTSNRLYFNGATTDSIYNSKFAGKTFINELNFGTAPQLATVATSGAYADLTGKPALSTVATSGSYADLSNKPSGTAPLSYNSGTNSFEISVASASTNGYLTSTDWSTFNAKYLLPSGGTTAQYLRGDGTLATFPTTLDSTRLIFTGKNVTGSTLTKGTVVYINGVSGNTALLAKAIASGDSTSAQTLGVVEFDIANNQSGIVVLVGLVGSLDTSSYTEGVQLYLSGTVAGAFTSSKILAPTHLVYVGIVTRAHPTQGTIEVKVQNGYELDEIHDVQISSPANKDILYHDTATSLWKHASIASVLGYTPYNATNPNNYIPLTALSASAPLSYNNTTGAFSITQANTSTNGFLSSTDWNTFNSKQSALTLGNVTEVASNVLLFPDGGTGKTIGNLSIQVVQAGASTNGFLSSTDWTTFNNKQNAITGAATTITASDLTASRALISNASGKVDVSTVTSTELGYLSGVTSAIQTQLNAKQGTITNPVTGTGTTNYVTKWTSSSAIGNSLIFDNGTNVGIGTTTPQERFEVAGVNGNIRVYGRTGVGENQIASNVYWNGTSWVRDNSSFGAVAIQLDSTNSRLVFSTTSATSGYPTERMRITSTGNLGVGTVDPFSDSGYVSTYIGGSTGGQLILGNSTGGAANRFLLLQGDSSAASILAFGSRAMDFYTNSALRMKITSAGNLGIGTSSPLDKLTVIGNSSFQLSDANDIRLVINPTSSGIAISSTYNTNGSYQPLIFKTSDAERMRITSGGILSVNNAITVYSQLNIKQANGNAFGGIGIYSNNGTESFLGIGCTGGVCSLVATYGNSGAYLPIQIQTGGQESLRITTTNNLLLGTSTDNGERLYVSGSIRATGNITANSDLTLKKNLKLVDNPIDKLNQLNGYLYQWKENDEYQYGVIAQEVEKILPHAVQTGKNGIKGVAYNQLIPLLIEGFKVQQKEINDLKSKIG